MSYTMTTTPEARARYAANRTAARAALQAELAAARKARRSRIVFALGVSAAALFTFAAVLGL